MNIKECKNAELDARNKTALYLDDFDSLEACKVFAKVLMFPLMQIKFILMLKI